MIVTFNLVCDRALCVHHLHGAAAVLHRVRVAGCARDQEQNHRGGHRPVQEVNQLSTFSQPTNQPPLPKWEKMPNV